jgi:hypothetical protein
MVIRWTRLNNSVCGAIMITSLGKLFFNSGGELLLRPGMFAELFLNVFFMLLNKDDDWYVAPTYTDLALNILILSPLLYFLTAFYLQLQSDLKGYLWPKQRRIR